MLLFHFYSTRYPIVCKPLIVYILVNLGLHNLFCNTNYLVISLFHHLGQIKHSSTISIGFENL